MWVEFVVDGKVVGVVGLDLVGLCYVDLECFWFVFDNG